MSQGQGRMQGRGVAERSGAGPRDLLNLQPGGGEAEAGGGAERSGAGPREHPCGGSHGRAEAGGVAETFGAGLSEDQRRVLELVEQGHSVFVGGAAGSGKTFVVRRLIQAVRAKHGHECVAATASTGCDPCALKRVGGRGCLLWSLHAPPT